ncbi:hypothetical protein WJX75_008130 [Coccomyxa subellipsoidea]|uniref:Ubiquitin-like domain-containing protein n=1 Tax=Coccomyxa subellipsoidea TaxID=248742 RepID=A0ABR2YB53_9CHLO
MKIFVRGDRTVSVAVEPCQSVESLISTIEEATGIPSTEQRLSYAGKELVVGHSLSTYSIEADSTLDLSLRLLGGAKNLQLTIKPRESMETKTEMLDDIKLALPPTARVADLQKEIEIKLGWEPTDKLERLEGFTDPWEATVFKGRLMLPEKTLEECGVPSGAQLTSVRRVLVPEGWRIIKEGEEEDDYTSSDEDW